MDNQNTSRQLRYLEEVRIPLHRAGFGTMPVEGESSCLSFGTAHPSAASPARAACSIGERTRTRPMQRMPYIALRTSPRRRWSI